MSATIDPRPKTLAANSPVADSFNATSLPQRTLTMKTNRTRMFWTAVIEGAPHPIESNAKVSSATNGRNGFVAGVVAE